MKGEDVDNQDGGKERKVRVSYMHSRTVLTVELAIIELFQNELIGDKTQSGFLIANMQLYNHKCTGGFVPGASGSISSPTLICYLYCLF